MERSRALHTDELREPVFYVQSERNMSIGRYSVHCQSLASPIPSALIANIASASGRHGES